MSYASVSAYIDSLPLGLDSYPECQAKASLVHGCLSEWDAARVEALPKPIADLIKDPPLPNAWVPEVHYNVLNLAIAEDRGLTHEEFAQLWYRITDRLFQNPIYRMFFRMMSAEKVLTGAALRWSAFHRGCELKVERKADHRAVFQLEYPAKLHPPLILEGYRGVMQRFVELSRQRGCRVTRIQSKQRSSSFRIDLGE